MKTKKIKETTYMVAKEILREKPLLSLLAIPMYLLVRYIVRNSFQASSFLWEELAGLTIVLVVSVLLMFSFSNFFSKKDFINMMIVSLSTYILFIRNLIPIDNIDNVVYRIITSSIFLFITIFFIIEIYLIIKKSYSKVRRIINTIIFFFGLSVSIVFLVSMLNTFGSQWVWMTSVPLALLFFLLTVYVDDFEFFNRFFYRKEDDISTALFLMAFWSIIFGVISTLYQFWFTKIIFGYVLWQVLVGLLLGILSIFLVYLIFSKILFSIKRKIENKKEKERKRKEEEEMKLKNDRIKKEEEDAKKKRETLNKSLLKALQEKDFGEKELQVAAHFLSPKNNKNLFIKIFLYFDLNKLFIISKGHQKIFWEPWIIGVFNAFSETLYSVRDDHTLYQLSSKIVLLHNELKKYSSFQGYDVLVKNAKYVNFQKLMDDAQVIYERLEGYYK